MKITNELLKKYAEGRCTDEEKAHIEKWMTSATTADEEVFVKEFEPHKESTWRSILVKVTEKHPETLSIFRTFIKVSAAASILFAAFLGGRVSANIGTSNSIKSKGYQEHLYIFGGNGAKGSLPGNRFTIEFDGTLRLFNSSQKEQTIVVGDSTFLLAPGTNYFLKGGTQEANLYTPSSPFQDIIPDESTTGDFSLYRIDKK
ncbi:MAG: hypothetical protein AAF717_03575 [Bacteroidota bacterium]